MLHLTEDISTEYITLATLPDKTQVQARIEGAKFIVIAIGTRDSLAEVGQQFAWLGAACRSSPFDVGIAICSPSIRLSPSNKGVSSAQVSQAGLNTVEVVAHIDFKIGDLITSHNGLPGQCWHNMFRNPLVVSGFPVLTKHEVGLGLEMPLNMVAGLVGSDRATEFDEKIFVKGFSAMLIASKVTKNLLLWHYLYNDNGGRISYLDHELQNIDDISLLELNTFRHVVGWCSNSEYFAGKVSD